MKSNINKYQKINNMKNCNYCKKEYNPQHVSRALGKNSSVLLGGFCSAQCYTKHTMNMVNVDDEKFKISLNLGMNTMAGNRALRTQLNTIHKKLNGRFRMVPTDAKELVGIAFQRIIDRGFFEVKQKKVLTNMEYIINKSIGLAGYNWAIDLSEIKFDSLITMD